MFVVFSSLVGAGLGVVSPRSNSQGAAAAGPLASAPASAVFEQPLVSTVPHALTSLQPFVRPHSIEHSGAGAGAGAVGVIVSPHYPMTSPFASPLPPPTLPMPKRPVRVMLCVWCK